MTYKNANKFIILASLIVIFMTISFPAFTPNIAYAADSHSTVLDDLRTDEKFDARNYQEDRTDYALYLMQIAESAKGDLFIYVYQPCPIAALTATKINMSLSQSVNGTQLYDLKLISRDGVFTKYAVDGLTVSSESSKRYYNISTIYRNWVSGLDEYSTADKNVRNSVAFAVGQLWTAHSEDGNVTYSAKDLEVVKITEQMVGFRRYSDGFQFANTKTCDAHYLAFSCDHQIDFLLSADIDFVTTDYKKMSGKETKLGAPMQHKVTLDSYQVASNDGSGWFGKKEEWHRMTSTKDFVEEVGETMSRDERKTLLQYDWILNFYETTYTNELGGKDVLISMLAPFGWISLIVDGVSTSGTYVSDVTLLRLEFSYEGEIYNLGVVADTQTGDTENPTNKDMLGFEGIGTKISEWWDDAKDTVKDVFKYVLIGVAALIGVIILFMIIRSIIGNRNPKVIVQTTSKPKSKKTSKKKKKRK